MKNIFISRTWAMLLAACFFLASCDKDDEGLETQPHDENKMMNIMHSMMTQMQGMQMTGDPDIDFAKMMIMHHQGAINMSNEEIASGDDATMKAKAQKIKAEQEKEIQEFNAFLTNRQPDQSDMAFGMEQMKAMEKMGRASDLRVITGDIDHDFAQLMIPHHQTAMENSQSLLHHGNSPEMKAKAQAIIDSQMQDIKDLQEWLLVNKKY